MGQPDSFATTVAETEMRLLVGVSENFSDTHVND
jgi:hypothetical protein